MKILKFCLQCPVPIMSIIARNTALYQQIDTRKGYFVMSHMSLYLKYQEKYHYFSAPMANHVPTSLLYP